MGKIAVVLFNLGGPDTPDAVQPFLFNLFNDRAIIDLPKPLRYLVATLISKKRAPIAKEIYAQIGDCSPILPLTKMQAEGLAQLLTEANHKHAYMVFTCMRYWHPMTKGIVNQVKEFDPDQVILLPLYPQFSTTTTGSSFNEWDKEARRQGLKAPTKRICCYPSQQQFVEAHASVIRPMLKLYREKAPLRLLFSAHGLPKKIVEKGDPYQNQVEQTVKAVVNELTEFKPDWQICYQSKVGPLEWIGPSTDDEIAAAGEEKRAVMIVPIAFVSEHSETLVELDVEYRELAEEKGVPHYMRVPALGSTPQFLKALSDMVLDAMGWKDGAIASDRGAGQCGRKWHRCPCLQAQAGVEQPVHTKERFTRAA